MNPTLFLLLTCFTATLHAAGLVVVVSGAADKGEVGCALYRSAEGFPMNPAKAAAAIRVKAAPQVECRFPDVPPGPAAIAVSVDLNGNRKTDKNFLGIPTEPWGVSNNARPAMRAPRFQEAAFTIPDGDLRIEVKVSK